MDLWSEDSREQRLIHAFSQFKKVDWNKHTVGDLKPSEVQVLFCIKKGYETVSEVRDILRVTSPTVTQIINRLEEKGYVERTVNKEDRRSSQVKLTDQGIAVTVKAFNMYVTSINGLIDYLGEEESEQLIGLLDKVFVYYKDLNSR
ncbi:MarR family winged helix-turn-helix transcriptional regulator [Aquibacillus kalidii]|uniref:MarR family winged helix-turn-helix transcriptional regulator n=1 Tax=Aquibacillus kalidii TaxID=2762597 RepID=UPI00164803CB|nr:MarR family winged helix-turn-helix transcriptional regulator [Aquibacillus kalidii]